MRNSTVLPMVLLLAACSQPFWGIPGSRLTGQEAALDMASIPTESTVLQLETNPDDPYSVNIGFRRIDGNLYIDPGASRQWFKNIQADPQVRIRFSGTDIVYKALAQAVTDPAILAQFEADRTVLQLVPARQR